MANPKAVSGVLRGIDHLVHAVDDLEGCADAFRRLGFTLTPRGRHRNMATGNYCIMFTDDYIELMGIIDPDLPDRGLRDRMTAQGEGLDRCAFAVDDVEAAFATLNVAGFRVNGPIDLRRPLELPEGEVEPRFRLIRFDGNETRLLNGFICYHDTPEITRRPDWLTHANAVTRILGLVAVSTDPATLGAEWARLLGADAIDETAMGIAMQIGPHVVEIVRHDMVSAVLPGLSADDVPAIDRMLAMRLAVSDIAATRDVLTGNGVGYTDQSDGSVFVPPGETGGTAISFSQEVS